MTYTVEQVIERYRQLKADQAVMSARHAEEMKPLNESLNNIETWLLAKMNQDGVGSYKTTHGTAYQSRLRSVKLEDPVSFRNYVLRPAADQILGLVQAGQLFQGIGGGTNGLLEVLGQFPLWDLADFRPGKKGIIKHQEETGETVPGVTFSEIIHVNVRGS